MEYRPPYPSYPLATASYSHPSTQSTSYPQPGRLHNGDGGEYAGANVPSRAGTLPGIGFQMNPPQYHGEYAPSFPTASSTMTPSNVTISATNHAAANQFQLPGLSSISPAQTANMAPPPYTSGHTGHPYPEIKQESPIYPSMSSVGFPAAGESSHSSSRSASFKPRYSTIGPIQSLENHRQPLRVQAIDAIRDLVQAGFRLEDIFNESDLRQSQNEIHALFQEAASSWPIRGSSSGQSLPSLPNAQALSKSSTAGAIAQASSLDNSAHPSPVSLPGLGSSQVNANASLVSQTKSIDTRTSTEAKTALPSAALVAPKNVPKPFTTSAPAPSKPSQSREQYLAKLAAARKKPTRESPANTSTDRASSVEQTPSIASTIEPKVSEPMGELVGQSDSDDKTLARSSSTPISTATSIRPDEDTMKAEPPKTNTIKTDILKQRLEALRRATAAKVVQEKVQTDLDSQPSTPPMISPPNDTHSDSQIPLHTRSLSGGNNLTPTHTSSSVLPGSFFEAKPTADMTNSTRKRPVAADFISNNSPPKRPVFRKAISPELCVIDISDSEEEDGMEIDNINGIPRSVMHPSQIGLLNHSPLRPLSGAQTPDPAAAEKLKELENKKKQLEARIAAMEQRKAKVAKGELLPPTPALLRSVSSPVSAIISTRPMRPSPSPAPIDENVKRKMQQKAQLDTQLLLKQARIEELRLQMLQVEEEFKQQQTERDEIATELEEVGVDTEGMSLEELRETQEVLHAKQEMQEEASGLQPTAEGSFSSESIMIQTPPEAASNAEEDFAPPVVQPDDIPSAKPEAVVDDDSKSDSSSEKMDLDDDEESPIAPSNEARIPLEPTTSSSSEEPVAVAENQVESGEIYSTPEAGVTSIPDYVPPPTSLPEIHAHPNEQSLKSSAPAVDLVADIGKEPQLAQVVDLSAAIEPDVLPDFAVQPSDLSPEITTLDVPPVDDLVEQDDEMDIESDSSSSNSTDEDDDYEPTLEVHQDTSPAPLRDVAPELRHYQETQDEKPSTKGSGPSNTYTPYESALKSFKAYRYHPQFLQSVPHGFNSLTYSNKIDPSKPMCPFELAGGSCNDPDCPNQHIRDMALTGPELLLQLGFNGVHLEGDEKKKYEDALKAHINNRVSAEPRPSFESLANSVVDFRREYLKDPSNILDLHVDAF